MLPSSKLIDGRLQHGRVVDSMDAGEHTHDHAMRRCPANRIYDLLALGADESCEPQVKAGLDVENILLRESREGDPRRFVVAFGRGEPQRR